MKINKKLVSLPNDWNKYLSDEMEKNYFKNLVSYLSNKYETSVIFPPIDNIYEALKYVTIDSVRFVLFGQDPYYRLGQANGLAFSLNKGVKLTPSLKNIFKEISLEYFYPIPNSGDLTPLAKQNVLLLNTVLTVEEGKPASHKNLGWDLFTSRIIQEIEKRRHKNNIVYAGHPSPLNTSKDKPFVNSNCFIKVNQLLKKYYNEEINFNLLNLE